MTMAWNVPESMGYSGQRNWGNQCKGKHQSPINIDSAYVQITSLPQLKLKDFQPIFGRMVISNNGHTVMAKLNISTLPTLSGGPLQSVYTFEQMHFHWGANDSVGSEYTFNGKAYPMELHIVFYRTLLGSFTNALAGKEGDLCVLAILFEVDAKPNDKINSFVKHLPNIIKSGSAITTFQLPSLLDYLPEDRSQYFCYNGSLTTPPCSEIVTWIEFRKPIKVSSSQLQHFRNLRSNEGKILANNFRAIQPLGDRKVWRNIADRHDKDKVGYFNPPINGKKVYDDLAKKMQKDLLDMKI